MANIKLEINSILGLVDLNGIEALDTEGVEKLEGYIEKCREASGSGMPIVADAVYDRLMEILKEADPDNHLLSEIWGDAEVSEEDFDDDEKYKFLAQYPMSSIQTIKDYSVPELQDFVNALPDEPFDLHYSLKENGHGIRLVYKDGDLISATSRARHGAGRDLTHQLQVIMGERQEELAEVPLCEVRGELLLPFENLDRAREFNSTIKTAFSGVSSMSRASASDEELELLSFVAYRFLSDDYLFETKDEEYDFLEEVGFEVPMSWLQEDVTKETCIDCIKSMLEDCEEDVEDYRYFTDGVVCEINSREQFQSMGELNEAYHTGNIALKVGLWKQDMYSGIVQNILWTQGKKKLSPVAIIAEEPDMIEYTDGYDLDYLTSLKEIENIEELGVATASGNRVKRVPLYEPNNIWILNALKGETLFFRFGGEAGVVPCFPDGKPLIEGRVEKALDNTENEEDLDYLYI